MYFVFQGALCGAWIGLAFNMVVIIGNYVIEPHREVLNTTMHNCSNLGFNNTIDDDEMPVNPYVHV